MIPANKKQAQSTNNTVLISSMEPGFGSAEDNTLAAE